jgi:hypothetical protein
MEWQVVQVSPSRSKDRSTVAFLSARRPAPNRVVATVAVARKLDPLVRSRMFTLVR